jgi:hypothetical protein
MQALIRGNNLHLAGCGPGNMSAVTVTKVERIENTRLWKDYHRKKASMAEGSRGAAPPSEVKPSGGHKVLDRALNEVSLFAVPCLALPGCWMLFGLYCCLLLFTV